MRYMVIAWNDGEMCRAVLLKDGNLLGEVALFPDIESAVNFADASGCDNFKVIDMFA